MPLKRGKEHVRENIREFRKGKTYQRTRRKYGDKRARKQAVAVALRSAGIGRLVHEKWG